jgi:hypothetical protein
MTQDELMTKYGFDRKADCGCCWSKRRHGNVCPEHGTIAVGFEQARECDENCDSQRGECRCTCGAVDAIRDGGAGR